ncbi:hypothetical protein CI109_104479 [Kwoniella shandongensis]|uniref:Calcineurin-like phosphoesterase domain-containing protein n=1 Tax=Kwoniella shandongensis TaxID=1734106 RepID=A0A5M6BSB6_9TREE|nr:uncharacterized protein CI109_006820 [Kwoniella shandongensis]KAA5524870.1 hypothetical protein CI109_006820 [Kwoniella shandongensis]
MSRPPSPPPRYDSTPPPTSPTSSTHSPSIPQYQHSYAQPPPLQTSSSQRPRYRPKPSFLDEVIPIPSSSSPSTSTFQNSNTNLSHTIRRSGSVAIISIFLLSIIFLASTDDSSTKLRDGAQIKGGGLRQIFGVGSQAGIGGAEWVAQDLDKVPEETTTSSAITAGSTGADGVRPSIDFEQYKTLRTLPATAVDVTSEGKRVIFIGDVHGSFDPLERLMKKIKYDPTNDRLIHVGDLIAKGSKNEQVLWWMNERRVLGVRGNHDQPVIQWRAWMEWAGGADWEAYMDSLGSGAAEGAIHTLTKEGKQFPKSWEWKGEHWKIARALPKRTYLYLLELPLVLHLPSLHTIVVHAGLLPADPTKSLSDPSQPLVQYANVTSDMSATAIRNSEEMSILFDIPQNQDPWNLINMRSVYTKGKKKGQITKSAKKGTPWSDLWKKQMGRCTGLGHWAVDGLGEWSVEHEQMDDEQLEDQEEGGVDETVHEKRQKPGTPEAAGAAAGLGGAKTDTKDQLGCSPVTVIYGHAAGRGLDIKQFSKGIDTGCVYGRQLTAMVLGDLKGLKGQVVRVGDHQGVLISEQCGEGGV